MKISWTEKKTNEEVMEMADYSRCLLKTIRKRQMNFFGHINRKDGLEKRLLCGRINGVKSRGRQRTKFTDSLNSYVTGKTTSNIEMIRKTEDRDEWRAMTADACNRHGT